MINLNIHHVRYSVRNVETFAQFLKTQLNFKTFAHREVSGSSSVVLNHENVIFVIEERVDAHKGFIDNHTADEQSFCAGNNVYRVDTVCDVCINCVDIEYTLKQVRRLDGKSIVVDLTKIEDEHGVVCYAVVKPPFGNIQHTLVDLTGYKGSFLPGFNIISHDDVIPSTNLIQTIDHIAFAVDVGETSSIVSWYTRCLGFTRLIINIDEDVDGGFVVREGTQGLRLKAVIGSHNDVHHRTDAVIEQEIPRFVFSEALDRDCSANQVTHFIDKHNGSGVQHIAFSTKDIVSAISQFKKQGLSCVLPPDSYYKEESKHKEIHRLNYETETLKSNNILLESHFSLPGNLPSVSPMTFNDSKLENQMKRMIDTHWFIMQVFTSTVFKEKTLFFEIIQRFQTLSGFGAGNISALWRAVQKELFQSSIKST